MPPLAPPMEVKRCDFFEPVCGRAYLLDLSMPGMDGWDFRANQLIDPDLSAIPVVVITAAGFRAETIQRQLAGVGFIRKPLLLDEVLTAVARSLPA